MKEIKKINQQRERAVLGAKEEEITNTIDCCKKTDLKAKNWPYSEQQISPTLG